MYSIFTNCSIYSHIALCTITLRPLDVLLLDYPTSHLQLLVHHIVDEAGVVVIRNANFDVSDQVHETGVVRHARR